MIESKTYHGDDLCQILFDANLKNTPLDLINEDINAVRYLKEYLGPAGLNANYYVKESNYVSIDYLTDYSFYYSKNFVNYGNKCVRLHFFNSKKNKKDFDKDFWDAVLIGNSSDTASSHSFWEEDYLGFIVVRPIPKFMIGYTILKHYNYRKDVKTYDPARNYWGIKPYYVHVFGTKVRIESLAFLSQDSNVAACATIAIWTMLQRAVEDYYINLKSPYEITKDSGQTIQNGNRIFPNSGLDPGLICNSITKNNLAPELRPFIDGDKNLNRRTKMIVHGYSRIRLPIIIGMNVQVGKHATAITGHRLQEPVFKAPAKKRFELYTPKKKDTGLLPLRSDNMNKFYMHDDQWGPFSRCEFKEGNKISTSWNRYTKETRMGEIMMLIIPVFQKIRIPIEDIEQYTFGLHNFLTKELSEAIRGTFNWDIQLYFSSDFKEEVRNSGAFKPDVPNQLDFLKKLVTEPLPKYLWVATLYADNHKMMYFVFDATGLRHTTSLLLAFSYYPVLMDKFVDRVNELKESVQHDRVAKINLEILFQDSIDKFIEKISWYKSYL
ncbi:MAG: hypothetical protein JWP78_2069 [Mucilaginibacter sp.]|nr:hypothetical protein [Mucilaginibacter sp.]